ncbi:MIP/aquaporin family protein [Streptococcus parauberis]|uniref:Aquaporin n=3 Tax=Streptococcus parauberis TaxID=1348 RepID=A0A0E2UAX7_9STRE|nr:aquaporin [Streptococcus parauberis]AUT05204.1 Aquaporin TIP3-1 [Streptococcus parauberis]EGE55164.1 MIP family channel protein [Streptococcus parauberis NCFD 2020]EMG24923.1 Aquaporin Z [Streptococcus parauberis KRS-02083]KYP17081.1 Aquaporin Z 2 [Streptococcus parauberis]KYP17283.1 Aquaporin Z 2 [Streptococcus parauberis]
MKKYISEFFGAFLLVFIGSATAVITKGSVLAIAMAFGLAITISAYTFGSISGGHFNPAVTTAMLIQKKISGKDAGFYMLAQFVGGLIAAGLIALFVKAAGLPANMLAQNDFPTISAGMAILVETLATFLFVTLILLVTDNRFGNPNFAGLIIGLSLTLLILTTISLTGASLNPARSFGPALLAGGSSLSHLWVYFLAPELGGALAAVFAKWLTSEDK